MKRLLLCAAALSLGTPGVAVAAQGDVACIATKLGPDALARIGNAVVAAADGAGNAASALNLDREALIAARDGCVRANGWSPDASQAAVSFAQAAATKIGATRALRADGVDPSKLDASYAALPLADRESLIGKISPRASAAVSAVAGGNARVRRHAGLYFAALAAAEFYPVDFAAA